VFNPILKYKTDFLLLNIKNVGMNPHFFDDGSAAPCRFSNQFTGPELLQHFNHWRIPYETDIHPDLLPYRGCDRSSNTFVRTVFWM